MFAQVTAQFETLPLQSPTVIRRLVEEAARPIKRHSVIHVAGPPPVKVATQPNAGVIDHTDVQAATPQSDKALAAIEAELVNSYRANEDLAARLSEQEENARALESALQQERAGRAELERKHLETQADLELFEKEVQSLEQQKQLALGDVSIEQSAALKPLWQDFNGLFNSLQNVASQFRRFEQDSLRLEELERDLGVANQTVINLKATIESLNRRQSSSDGAGPSTSSVDRDDLMNLLPEMVQKNPPLKCSLGVIAAIFPDRVAVLDSALASAARSDEFKYGGQAFELLWTLGTSYWETIQSGKGDSEARKHFGINAFSTQESVKLTKSGRNSRTFEYRGRLRRASEFLMSPLERGSPLPEA